VELLRMAEKDAVQYGLHFEDKPSEEQVRDILDAARASLEARRQGMPGIDISQYMYISQQLSAGGNIKELSALLDYLQKKSEQTIQANKERDIQMQNEGLARIEQQKAQTAAQQKQADVQGDVILEREKRMTELQKIREERGERQAPAGTSNQPPQPSSPQSSPQVPVGA
jgi:hypothetical protein